MTTLEPELRHHAGPQAGVSSIVNRRLEKRKEALMITAVWVSLPVPSKTEWARGVGAGEISAHTALCQVLCSPQLLLSPSQAGLFPRKHEKVLEIWI